MKKSKFVFINVIALMALIIFLTSYIIILCGNMGVKYIVFGLSLASFGLGVGVITFILNHIKIEEE